MNRALEMWKDLPELSERGSSSNGNSTLFFSFALTIFWLFYINRNLFIYNDWNKAFVCLSLNKDSNPTFASDIRCLAESQFLYSCLFWHFLYFFVAGEIILVPLFRSIVWILNN